MARVTISCDPVCHKDVEIAHSLYSTTYRGLVFHFCSAQCLENFQNNPDLYAIYIGLRRKLAILPILKRRRLRLMESSTADMAHACQCIGEMIGISLVRAEYRHLIVEYDLKQATLSQIEAVVLAAGVKLSGGFHGLRRWLWRSAEMNELANAAHPSTGACCNKPPVQKR
jgi:YHS domain-containing protein